MKQLKFALCGYPVGHSLSPLIFKILSQKLNIPIDYQLQEIQNEQELLSKFDFLQQEYHGINLTTPLKIAAKQKIQRYQHFHAYNCVRFADHQECVGTNTDYLSVKALLCSLSLPMETALLFGTGGAAIGALHSLHCLNFKKITIVYHRQYEHIKKSAESLGVYERCCFRSLDQLREDFSADLLINATPLGLGGSHHPMEKSVHQFKAIFDMIYAPAMTPLILRGQEANKQIITGDRMLVWQALKSFEFWTEKQLENVEQLHSEILSQLYV